MEDLVREVVGPEELGMIVSNIGLSTGFSSIYTSNSGMHTAFVQVSLKEGHKLELTSTWSVCVKRLRQNCRSFSPTSRRAAWWTPC